MSEWKKTSQRTVKCRKCGERRFYLWEKDGRSELRDAATGDTHISCSPEAHTSMERVNDSPAPQAPAPILATATLTADQKDELAGMIPDKSALLTYVPRKLNGHTDLDALATLYDANVQACQKGERPISVLLISDTGAGKSHLSRALAAKLQLPYLRVAGSGGLTVDGLVGKYTLPEAGKTVWQDGRLTTICRSGGIVMLDEINALPAEVAFILHPALDDDRLLILDDKPEAVKISPRTFFIAAINPDYQGTRPLNAAFQSRFAVKRYLDYDADVEKKLVKDERLLKLAKSLRASFRSGDGTVTTPVSTRDLLDFERNKELVGVDIARDSFVSMFPFEEQGSIRQMVDLIANDAQDINVDEDVNLDSA